MTMLKTISGHKSAAWIGRYLLHGNRGAEEWRALDIDSRNIVDPMAFWIEMDETRRLWGKFMHAATGRGRAREYYHFVLSPDAADNATLEQVKELANRWVDENIGDGFQVAIVYHDDNEERLCRGEEGIVHAHVVVNSVDSLTGAKLQIGRAGMDVDDLADSLQRIAEELGLSAFDNADRAYKRCNDGARDGRPNAARKRVEKLIEIRDEGSFKEEIRRAVDDQAQHCENLRTLRARLAPYGFGIARTPLGIVYISPEGKRVGWRALGAGYGEEGLSRKFSKVSFIAVESTAYSSFAERYRASAFAVARVDEHLARLQRTIDVYSVISREGVGSMEDFSGKIEALREFGAVRRKDLYIANKSVERFNEGAKALRSGDESSDAQAALAATGFFKDGETEWMARYRLEGEALLAAQADVDGIARRIDDLQAAREVAAEVLDEVSRRADEERGEGSVRTRFAPRPVAHGANTPPWRGAATRTVRAPYWKLQIKSDKYKEIAQTSRAYRAHLLEFERASNPNARMRPYASRSEQISRSMEAQRRYEISRGGR